MAIDNEDDLGEALKNGDDTIEIEGDLKNKVIRIRATGKVAWAVAAGALAIAVGITISTGGAGAPVSGLMGVGAVSILGLPTATAAVLVAVSAGGIGALNSLRKYKQASSSSDDILVLKRK